jgi:hypothetical protein
MKLFLRVFADCWGEEYSINLSNRLQFGLSKFSPSLAKPPKPYWKMREKFEFTYLLSPANVANFNQIIQLSSSGWNHIESGEELSSVWNRRNDNIFLLPEVSWAEIQLF